MPFRLSWAPTWSKPERRVVPGAQAWTIPFQPASRIAWWYLSESAAPSVVHKTSIMKRLNSALGLILPVATGLYPWLTPNAAAGLALLMFMAASFHAQRRETGEAALNVLLLILLAIVAYIRWPLLP
ncbi:MAG: DoxX family protein [Anaerolineales bacterium]|nr:DoxX family protein [Anaerolineales bacterium]